MMADGVRTRGGEKLHVAFLCGADPRDDAERAVRAGLRVLEGIIAGTHVEIAELEEKIKQPLPPEFRNRGLIKILFGPPSPRRLWLYQQSAAKSRREQAEYGRREMLAGHVDVLRGIDGGRERLVEDRVKILVVLPVRDDLRFGERGVLVVDESSGIALAGRIEVQLAQLAVGTRLAQRDGPVAGREATGRRGAGRVVERGAQRM